MNCISSLLVYSFMCTNNNFTVTFYNQNELSLIIPETFKKSRATTTVILLVVLIFFINNFFACNNNDDNNNNNKESICIFLFAAVAFMCQ